jgi:DNA-binding MarR family transcriptional regulator
VRPLGYWIKEIDRRIEADFGRLLVGEGLTRRHWQVLSTLAHGPRTDLDAVLAPFAPTVRPEVEDLMARGWVTEPEPDSVALTVAGQAAHDRVAEQVRMFRAQVTEGLTEQEYATLVTLLERIAGNLTPA